MRMAVDRQKINVKTQSAELLATQEVGTAAWKIYAGI